MAIVPSGDGWTVLEKITLIGAVVGAVAYVGRTIWHTANALLRFSANVARMDAFIDQFEEDASIAALLADIDRKLSWVSSRSRALLEESYRVAAFEANLDGHCTWANRTLLEWAGMTSTQIKSSGWRMTIAPAYREAVTVEWERAVRKRSNFDYLTYVLDLETGETRPVRCVAYVAKDQNGKPLGWVGLMREVTEERVRSFNGEV